MKPAAVHHESQVLWSDAGGELLQTLPLGPSLGQQLAPVVGRMAAFKHLAKHPVGIVAAFVGALGVLIVDPREHDHFAGRVVAEEQAVLLEEPRPEPMLVVVANRLLAFFFTYSAGSFCLKVLTCCANASICARNSGWAKTVHP